MSLKQNQCRHHVNFTWDPLRSYFDEPQKNEIHLLHLHIRQKKNICVSGFSSEKTRYGRLALHFILSKYFI